jgi:hypothetical protein
MQHTLPDYIATKIKQPRAFSGLEDAAVHLHAPAQIDSLTTALLSLNDRSHAASFAAVAQSMNRTISPPAKPES